mgnify:FL=1
MKDKKSPVDIQPGHVRERQFQELGETVNPIRKSGSSKHNKASEPQSIQCADKTDSRQSPQGSAISSRELAAESATNSQCGNPSNASTSAAKSASIALQQPSKHNSEVPSLL